MNQKLIVKISDFTKYATLAARHFREGDYGDSALNCRRAGEACCKVLLYHRYSENVADEKIEGRSFKELIQTVMRADLADRNVINRLETLQITGNKAAHDNTIQKEESSYAVNALGLLADWLFAEHLQIRFPKDFDFSLEKTAKETVVEKIIIREQLIQEKMDREIEEELRGKMKLLDERAQLEANEYKQKYTSLYKELEETRESIRTIGNAKEVKPKKKNKKLLLVFSAVILTGIISLILISSKTKHQSKFVLLKHKDSIYVGLNTIGILQENPNIDFKISALLQEKFEALKLHGLPVALRITPFKDPEQRHDKMWMQARENGLDYFISGVLYETALNDSNKLILELSNTNLTRRETINFRSVSDSAFIKKISYLTNIPLLDYAVKETNGKKKKHISKILDQSVFYGRQLLQSWIVRGRIAKFSEDHETSDRIASSLLKQYPNNYEINYLKAEALTELEKFDSAETFLKRVWLMDTNKVNPVLSLAYMYMKKKDRAACEKMVYRAVQIAPKKDTVLMWLGYFQYSVRDYTNARQNLYKALAINPLMRDCHLIFGDLFAFTYNVRDSAEAHYFKYSPDTSEGNIAGRLASYYLQYYPQEKNRIAVLLEKSRSEQSKDNIAREYALGLKSFSEKNYKQCIYHLEPLVAKGFNSPEFFLMLSKSYYFSNDLRKAYYYIAGGLRADSLSSALNEFYADLASEIDPYAYAAIQRCYLRAMQPAATRELAEKYLNWLCRIQRRKEAMERALTFIKNFPESKLMNMLLAENYFNAGNYNAAIPYYEFLHNIKGMGDSLQVMHAQCILATSSPGDANFVRGAGMVKKLCDRQKSNAMAHFITALYFIRGSNKQLGKKYYQTAIAIDKSLKNKDVEIMLNE